MTWWVLGYLESGGPILLVSWIFWVILSITLHELAHGWTALWQGDDTPRTMHRMTMNPLVHMGPMALIVFALIGITWGLMPVDPAKFRWRRKGRIMVAGAGPAMNLLIAFVSLTAASIWFLWGPDADPLHTNVFIFLSTGGWLNIALAIFNLLPVPPLDGFQILTGASFRVYRLAQREHVTLAGWFVIMVVFVSGVWQLFYDLAFSVSQSYIHAVVRLMG